MFLKRNNSPLDTVEPQQFQWGCLELPKQTARVTISDIRLHVF